MVCMPVIPAPSRWRLESQEFKASLCCMVRWCFRKQKDGQVDGSGWSTAVELACFQLVQYQCEWDMDSKVCVCVLILKSFHAYRKVISVMSCIEETPAPNCSLCLTCAFHPEHCTAFDSGYLDTLFRWSRYFVSTICFFVVFALFVWDWASRCNPGTPQTSSCLCIMDAGINGILS